jgi:hypothetical protein
MDQTQAIDNVFRTTRNAPDETTTAEGKRIVEQLAKLKYELQHDRLMRFAIDCRIVLFKC